MLVGFLAFLGVVWAAEEPKCVGSIRHFGNAKVTVLDSCDILVKHVDDGIVGREISLGFQGAVGNFVSLDKPVGGGECDDSTCTGSYNTYAVLEKSPAPAQPSVEDRGSTIRVTSATGLRMDFSKETSFPLAESPDFELEVAPQYSFANQGGVRVKRFKRGILLDGGWTMAGDPFRFLGKSSKATGHEQKSCTVSNSVFIKKVGSGDIRFKFDDTRDFLKGLSKVKGCERVTFPPTAPAGATEEMVPTDTSAPR